MVVRAEVFRMNNQFRAGTMGFLPVAMAFGASAGNVTVPNTFSAGTGKSGSRQR
jgi:hypothetical protein